MTITWWWRHRILSLWYEMSGTFIPFICWAGIGSTCFGSHVIWFINFDHVTWLWRHMAFPNFLNHSTPQFSRRSSKPVVKCPRNLFGIAELSFIRMLKMSPPPLSFNNFIRFSGFRGPRPAKPIWTRTLKFFVHQDIWIITLHANFCEPTSILR